MMTWKKLCRKFCWVLLAPLMACSTPQIKTKYVTIYKTREIVCNIPKPVPQALFRVRLKKVQDKEGTWWILADDANFKLMAINNARILKYSRDSKQYRETLLKCIKKES